MYKRSPEEFRTGKYLHVYLPPKRYWRFVGLEECMVNMVGHTEHYKYFYAASANKIFKLEMYIDFLQRIAHICAHNA